MWTKICGIRDEAGLQAAVAADVDAIGLNFFPQSPRYVEVERAAELAVQLPATVLPVGLFVNEQAENVAATCQRCGIHIVQLHGDETPDELARLAAIDASLQLIRAFRVGDEGLGEVEEFIRQIGELNLKLFACLIDARAENVYGGSGRQAPWTLIRDEYRFDDWPPLILAGGLTPENVLHAIECVQPWGVDVAGGVESAPGVKDKNLIEQFVASARSP